MRFPLRIEAADFGKASKMIGHVNADDFRGFSAGTLLISGFEASHRPLMNCWSATVFCEYRPNGFEIKLPKRRSYSMKFRRRVLHRQRLPRWSISKFAKWVIHPEMNFDQIGMGEMYPMGAND